ncbi:hypothetical protein EV2_021978 [Malus domestica]
MIEEKTISKGMKTSSNQFTFGRREFLRAMKNLPLSKIVAPKKTKKTHESINTRFAHVMKCGKYTVSATRCHRFPPQLRWEAGYRFQQLPTFLEI